MSRFERFSTPAFVFFGLVLAAILYSTNLSKKNRPETRPLLVRNAVAPMYDDGFYYLTIARSLAHGKGSSFDGVHPTNGYHPLWLLHLSPIFWLTEDGETALLLALLIQIVYFSVGLALLYRLVRLRLGGFAASLAVFLWIAVQMSYWMVFSGMEYGLQAVLLLATALFYHRGFTPGPPQGIRPYFWLGLLAGLCFLARLDTLLLSATLGMSLAARFWYAGRFPAAGKQLLWFALPVIVFLGIYLAVNFGYFGQGTPVSAALKREWSQQLLVQDPLYQTHGWLAAKLAYLFWPVDHLRRAFWLPLLVGTLGVGAFFLALIFKQRIRFPNWFADSISGWRPFWWFALLQWMAFTLVYHGGFSYQPWNYVMPLLLFVILAAHVAEFLWNRLKNMELRGKPLYFLGRGLALICWLAIPLYGIRMMMFWKERQRHFYEREPIHAGARWVAGNLPDDAVIGAWNAGTLGYFSGKRVINLDGLVNSWRYFREKRFDLCGYWRETGVTHLVDVFEKEDVVAYMESFYAPQTDLSPCAADLELVWIGPAYSGSTRHVQVYELKPQGGTHER